MKRVIKSMPEPECLSTYRTDNPSGTWDGCKDVRNCNSEIRSRARTDQHNLCAFCEISLIENNEQIAHFHPKSDKNIAINWGLKWTNLLLACKGGTQAYVKDDPSRYLPPLPENRSCDENKEDKIVDELVLNPTEIAAFPRLFRYVVYTIQNRPGEIFDAVEIHPDKETCAEASIDPEKVSRTIEVFNLNCSRLARARFLYYRPIEQQIKRLRESNFDEIRLKDARIKLSSIYLGSPSNGWASFFTMIRWHLGSSAEDYLRSIHYQG